MVNAGPLTAEIDLPVWGTPAIFNGFRVLPSLLHRRRLTEVNQTLHDMFRRLLGWYTTCIYTFSGTLAPDGILPGTKFTLRSSPKFGRAATTLEIGPHSS